DAVRAPDDGLGREVVGDAYAGTDVLEIGRRLARVLRGDEADRAGEAPRIEVRIGGYGVGDRRSSAEVEGAQSIQALGPRHAEVVPEAEVDGQVGGRLPVVLDVERPVRACRGRRRIVADRAGVRYAEQQRRETEAGGRAALVGIELRPSLSERVLARRGAELQEREQELAKVHTELDEMPRQHLRCVDVE